MSHVTCDATYSRATWPFHVDWYGVDMAHPILTWLIPYWHGSFHIDMAHPILTWLILLWLICSWHGSCRVDMAHSMWHSSFHVDWCGVDMAYFMSWNDMPTSRSDIEFFKELDMKYAMSNNSSWHGVFHVSQRTRCQHVMSRANESRQMSHYIAQFMLTNAELTWRVSCQSKNSMSPCNVSRKWVASNESRRLSCQIPHVISRA